MYTSHEHDIAYVFVAVLAAFSIASSVFTLVSGCYFHLISETHVVSGLEFKSY